MAGRSNALSAFVDANTPKPVIACPPYSEKFSGKDIYSSLRVPSGIGSVVTIEPEGAAIAAAKILAAGDKTREQPIKAYQAAKESDTGEGGRNNQKHEIENRRFTKCFALLRLESRLNDD